MIPLSSIQRTAEDLMAKAAIEIPDDYLAGLRRCVDTEKGDLSSFVIKAMLENYEAAKEDRRAMCGDTGLPRWYVKIGNDARIEGGPVALETALRRATTTMSASTRRKSSIRFIPTPTGSSSPPYTKAACSARTTACCFPATASKALGGFISTR
jgi:tartrate dehydratase alpha subunit/fumarate hydratase class I-like protein